MNSRSLVRPIILALRILGVFPLTKKRGKEAFKFSWLSVWMINAAFIYVGSCAISVIVAKPMIDVIYSFGSEGGFRGYATLAALWPNFILPIVCLLSSKSLAGYLNQWKIIEEEFFLIGGKHIRFPPLRIASLASIACCIVIEPVVTLSMRIFLEDSKPLEAILHLRSHLVFNILLTLWHGESRLLSSAFDNIADDFSTSLSSWREASPILINRYKLLYSRTASLATSFGGSIGLVIGISCLGLYLEMTIAAYAVIVYLTDERASLSSLSVVVSTLFSHLLYSAILLQTTCELGRRIADAGGTRFAERISPLNPLHDLHSRIAFLRLMDTVHLTKPRIRIAGCIKIDRGLTVNGLSIMFGYLVIMYQFRSSG